MSFRKSRLIGVILVLCVGALLYCARTESGQVIDGGNGKPVSGVYVIVVWNGWLFGFLKDQHTCFSVQVTVSDENGRFTFPSSSWNFNPTLFSRDRTLFVYKRGYKTPVIGPDDEIFPIVMLPDERTGLERLKYIIGTAGGTSCGTRREQQATVPYRRAVYNESKEIAKSTEELRWLNGALRTIERLELGSQVAGENFDRRQREWGIR